MADARGTIWPCTYFLISYMLRFNINNSSVSSSVWIASKTIIKLPWKLRPPAKMNHTVSARTEKAQGQKESRGRKSRQKQYCNTKFKQTMMLLICQCAFSRRHCRLQVGKGCRLQAVRLTLCSGVAASRSNVL